MRIWGEVIIPICRDPKFILPYRDRRLLLPRPIPTPSIFQMAWNFLAGPFRPESRRLELEKVDVESSASSGPRFIPSTAETLMWFSSEVKTPLNSLPLCEWNNLNNLKVPGQHQDLTGFLSHYAYYGCVVYLIPVRYRSWDSGNLLSELLSPYGKLHSVNKISSAAGFRDILVDTAKYSYPFSNEELKDLVSCAMISMADLPHRQSTLGLMELELELNKCTWLEMSGDFGFDTYSMKDVLLGCLSSDCSHFAFVIASDYD